MSWGSLRLAPPLPSAGAGPARSRRPLGPGGRRKRRRRRRAGAGERGGDTGTGRGGQRRGRPPPGPGDARGSPRLPPPPQSGALRRFPPAKMAPAAARHRLPPPPPPGCEGSVTPPERIHPLPRCCRTPERSGGGTGDGDTSRPGAKRRGEHPGEGGCARAKGRLQPPPPSPGGGGGQIHRVGDKCPPAQLQGHNHPCPCAPPPDLGSQRQGRAAGPSPEKQRDPQTPPGAQVMRRNGVPEGFRGGARRDLGSHRGNWRGA